MAERIDDRKDITPGRVRELQLGRRCVGQEATALEVIALALVSSLGSGERRTSPLPSE